MSSTPQQLGFEAFEAELLNPLSGHALTDIESYIASLLLNASQSSPLTNAEIRDFVNESLRENLDERTVKEIILRLRNDHHFPIMASKQKPFGYWWCRSPEEMIAHIERVRGEAIGMLATLAKIVKANFPELLGQFRFDWEGLDNETNGDEE